jgi:hypothetical protein
MTAEADRPLTRWAVWEGSALTDPRDTSSPLRPPKLLVAACSALEAARQVYDYGHVDPGEFATVGPWPRWAATVLDTYAARDAWQRSDEFVLGPDGEVVPA